MNRYLLLLLFLTFSVGTNAQSIIEAYFALPEQYARMSLEQREKLTLEIIDFPESNDTLISEKFEIEVLDTSINYLIVSQSYTTGQAAWSRSEFRIYQGKMKNVLIASHTSGTRVDHHTQGYYILEILKEPQTETLSFKEMNVHGVHIPNQFRKNTPAEYIDEDSYYFCYSRSLDPATYPNGYGFETAPCYILSKEIEDYLLTPKLTFLWTGSRFKKGKPSVK